MVDRDGQYLNMDLGQMVLVYNQALVARSSQDIIFFRYEWNEMEQKKMWT
jgi:hypothetical protein